MATKTDNKTKYAKILGYTVKVGSKRHQILLSQVRHFNDLAQSETGNGRKEAN